MSLQVAFGDGVSNVPYLISEFSIHMLGRTDNNLAATYRKRAYANRECEKLSIYLYPTGHGPHWRSGEGCLYLL